MLFFVNVSHKRRLLWNMQCKQHQKEKGVKKGVELSCSCHNRSLFLLVLCLHCMFCNFLEKIHSQKIASDLQSESSSLVLKGLTVSPMHNPFCKEFIHSFKILCLHSFNIEKLYHQQVCWRLWNFIARQMEINNVFFCFQLTQHTSVKTGSARKQGQSPICHYHDS